ncbi:hypothetical protein YASMINEVIRUS_604 [Yasminevirus sp. GU-2018]|uniref:Adenylosuccinate lyase n=1 Tax=Yasminevirus sp. GU-2018 TaxID=2420051 RepID=A0A5K0U9A6_9VIRU|nr:hypothetical protein YASMINEVIRUS_604 [Yasminevirus sp. GU-2018]
MTDAIQGRNDILRGIIKKFTQVDVSDDDLSKMMGEIRTVTERPSISVVDGRYAEILDDFRLMASDQHYYMMRMRVELVWLSTVIRYINESEDVKSGSDFEVFKSSTYKEDIDYLAWLSQSIDFKNKSPLMYQTVANIHYEKIREIEKVTQHDVKAIEYYLRTLIGKGYHNLLHICITSQDANSVAMTCILQDECDYFVNKLDEFLKKSERLFGFDINFLERTHGQIAVKGNMGHFIKKLVIPIIKTRAKLVKCSSELTTKFSSSTGNYSTLLIGFKSIDTIHELQQTLALKLGHTLTFNDYARQIDDYTSYVELCQVFATLNLQIRSFMEQIWLMITRGHIVQKKVTGEIGSSVMPQKVNPWRIEQGFGLFQNAYSGFNSVAQALMASRDARDMSDSVTLRFMQEYIAYTILLMNTFSVLIDRIEPNSEFCQKEIDDNQQWKGEIVQTHLRIINYTGDSYAQTAEFMKGRSVSKEDFNKYVDSFDCLSPSTRDSIKRA